MYPEFLEFGTILLVELLIEVAGFIHPLPEHVDPPLEAIHHLQELHLALIKWDFPPHVPIQFFNIFTLHFL